jgi:FkbM family methyltransferase
MNRSLLGRIWNASPRSITLFLFPRLFTNRIVFEPQLPSFYADKAEIKRLMNMPRYVPTMTEFMGKTLNLVDASSFLAMCDELFVRKNYEFEAHRKDPLIIDCGANIGLSIIFFKKLYPSCKVIAFEADENVFKVLQKNIESFEFKDVELHNKAVWFEETELPFHAEGSWGGSVIRTNDVTIEHITKVKSVRLKNYLARDVDLLKIDVEGAESYILKDCANNLKRVEHLFFEYHSFVKERQVLQELLTILQNSGFRYHIKEASTRKIPFINKTATGMDMQLDIFAYRPR